MYLNKHRGVHHKNIKINAYILGKRAASYVKKNQRNEIKYCMLQNVALKTAPLARQNQERIFDNTQKKKY